jgi:pyruvate dehydrogenase E2 component (dihydrolipoamide acetyltransferase)
MQVKGTGPSGRITEEDLHKHVRDLAAGPKEPQAAPGAPAVSMPDFAQWGPVDRQPISNIRRKTAESMTAAWRTVPQVTQYDLCDITDLEAQRKRYMQAKGEKAPKITVTAILLKAVVAALKEFPKFNSSFDMQAGELIYKKYFHIGVAVDTEHGLLVPVIRDVDRKSVVQLAKELDEIAKRARDRKLALEKMRGSCFTITNLGGIGGTAFSPIVYWPEVAILGVARARQEQVIQEGAAQIRLMMPLCLSYDHRVIDGADGARFCRRLASILSDPLSLFMEA